MLTSHTKLGPVISRWDFPHELTEEDLSHMIKLQYHVKQGTAVTGWAHVKIQNVTGT